MTENTETTAEVALARLRLFLSPHAREENGEQQDTASSCDGTLDAGSLVPKSGEVATIRPLPPISREFLRVKYLLQASLPGNELGDNVMIWDMRNPSLVEQYEQHTSGFLELDSWVGVHDLGPENCMTDVYSCGFTSPKPSRGMKFTTGNLILDNPTKKGRRTYVLCKIAVGRSCVIDEDATTKVLPVGYHSFYIRRKEQDARGYYHEYVINNSLQVLPQYLVQFNCSPLQGDRTPECALCEKRNASINCKACEANLCSGCDKEVHSANKLVSRHKRQPLKASAGESTPIFVESTCSKHKDISVEFYCPTCCTPVCVHCKMVGDHSCGEPASHRLVSISDAYTAGLQESNRADPLIESRQGVIEEKLKMINNRIVDIERNSDAVEKAIRQCMEEALKHLGRETKGKITTLRGEELELKRQVEHINWAEAFLCQQRRLLNPVEFLNSWNHHKILRTELRDFPVMHLPSAEHVKADLQLVGRLQVIAGEDDEFSSSNQQETTPSLMKKLMTTDERSTSDTMNRVNHVLSPKSTQLIAQVKNELARGTTSSKTLNFKSKSNQNRRPSASGLNLGTLTRSTAAPHRRQKTCNDEWTENLRSEMQKAADKA